MLELCKLLVSPNDALGLHLNRAPWDPYPWISGIQENSSAQQAGLRDGDTVLKINGRDILGQKIVEIADDIFKYRKSGASYLSLVIWRNLERVDGETEGKECAVEQREEHLIRDGETKRSERNGIQQRLNQQRHTINQQSLKQFATCLQHIAQLLECPVCLEVIRPPGWQCCNGHVFCHNCRQRSVKCPVCRVTLGPRGRCLLSDKLYGLLVESFPCDGFKVNQARSNEMNNSVSSNTIATDKNSFEYKMTSKNKLRNCMSNFNKRSPVTIAVASQTAAKTADK